MVKVHSPIMSQDIFCVHIMKGCLELSVAWLPRERQKKKVSIRLLSGKSSTEVFLLARL